MFSIGQTVIVFHGSKEDDFLHPVSHNSGEFKDQSCRAKVLKIGRKYLHVSSTGSPLLIRLDGKGKFHAFSIEEGKERHRQNFNKPNEYRTKKQIEEIIERL